jgi:hypothetical protein
MKSVVRGPWSVAGLLRTTDHGLRTTDAIMTIRFKCPNCQKTLGVKDHLAGKKVACPVCKNAIKIPAPVAAPGGNVEDMAAAALADGPKAPEPVKEAKPIEFTCVFCDAQVSVPVELGGKQTPCPECKRIVKVPKLVEDKPKDWRTVDTRSGPSFAKQNEPAAPDGAWAPAEARKVSHQALAEAGAVPEVPAEPVGIRVWIRRGVVATAGVAVVVALVMWRSNASRENTLVQGLTKALEFIEPKSKLGPAATAALHRAAGEFYGNKPDPKKALEHLSNARAEAQGVPADGPGAIEHDALLRDIALTLVDLGGNNKEKEDGAKLGWDRVQQELGRTLLKITAVEAQALTLRDVASRLLEKGPEAGVAALSVANNVGGAAGGASAAGAAPHSPLTAQKVAILLAQGKAEMAAQILALPKEEEITDVAVRLAYAEGLARQGKFAEAMQLAERKGPPLDRLQALLGVAAIAAADRNSTSRGENTRPALVKAFALVEAESKKGFEVPVWDRIQLGRLAARAGLEERVPLVLGKLPDKAARGRVQLELVRVQLDAAPGFVDPAVVKDLPDKEALAHGLALEALARHNTRVGSRTAVLESIEGLEENQRPFVFVGLALGEEDASKR